MIDDFDEETQQDKLMSARCRLLIRVPFYGHMCTGIEWIASEMSWRPEKERRMGIRIVQGGQIQVLYYKPYVESRNIKQLYGEIQHLIEHLIRLHLVRRTSREKQNWNIATDFCVNGHKQTKEGARCGYDDKHGTVYPYEDMIFIPSGIDDTLSAEQYYQMLTDNKIPKDQGQGKGKDGKGKDGKGKDQGQGKGQKSNQPGGSVSQNDPNSQGGGKGQKSEKEDHEQDEEEQDEEKQENEKQERKEDDLETDYGQMIDDHEVWNQSDVSEDEARQLVRDMTKQAAEKSQGHVPGHLKQALEDLEKPKVRWRELLRRYLGTHCGNQRHTYSRINRRIQEFGQKGISHHAAATLTIIVDTSGSVSNDMLEQFFGEIDFVSSRAKITVIQWDAQFQGCGKYRRGMWKNWNINGRGGTDMDGPVKFIEENGMVGDLTVMLTDGICNWPTPERSFPMVFVIASERHDAEVKGPDWGHLVRIVI